MIGVTTGCVLAAAQILHDVRIPVRLLPGVAARVNGRDIDAAGVDRTVAGFDASLRGAPQYARSRVVARMVDEELLVQHAIDSGVAETDPELRAALVRAAINRVNAEVASQPVTEQQLLRFYDSHRASYATPARYAVTPLYFASSGAPELPFEPPTGLTTARTLVNYYGPAVLDQLAKTAAGKTTDPVPFGRGVLRLRLDRRIEGEVPRLAEIRDLVQADTLRERQETALQGLLGSLRSAARLEVSANQESTPDP